MVNFHNYRGSLFILWLLVCANMINAQASQDLPNVILVMADDMGYECLDVNGAAHYKTPVLDQLARQGMNFTNCIAQPLCTPSRVKIMTGQYNYRNYEYFGYLNEDQHTFGTLFKEVGYTTCIVGKWQLNGLAYDLQGYQDKMRPKKFGFDEFCLWQLTQARNKGERFANPLIEQNGETLPRDDDAYGPDIFCQYALDFITRHRHQPFFLYYPMVLVHDPFVPTPDTEAWQDPSRRYEKDTAYFKDMMAYTDKIIGKLVEHLQTLNIFDNTLLIFTADNGTHYTIYTPTISGIIQGAKGNTIKTGTHVPLVISWPAKIKQPKVYDDLIEFSDFYPTFAQIVGRPTAVDGKSFLPVLQGDYTHARETAFVHYDPRWGKRVNQFRNQFMQTKKYKLYQDGRFFDIENDPLEQRILTRLTPQQLAVKKKLADELARAPAWANN